MLKLPGILGTQENTATKRPNARNAEVRTSDKGLHYSSYLTSNMYQLYG
jgi:hypothetical protein